MMSDDSLFPQAYATVLKHFVQHGRAPHYTEIANILDISMDEARILLRDTAAEAPIASCWLSHDTDYIESWAPFSSIPTHTRVSVDGIQKWYAQ